MPGARRQPLSKGGVLLDFESVTDIDPTASEALTETVSELQEAGKVIGIARASAPVQDLLDFYEITGAIGPDHIYPSNRAALADYLKQGGGAGDQG
jgi:MFS superfamily sulfate permease-like transporter